MAATVVSNLPKAGKPSTVDVVRLSGLTSDLVENITHRGPSGAKAFKVSHVVTTLPTSHDPVYMEWDEDADSTSNNTVAVRFYTRSGGSLTGAIVDLYIEFVAAGSGGTNVANAPG